MNAKNEEERQNSITKICKSLNILSENVWYIGYPGGQGRGITAMLKLNEKDEWIEPEYTKNEKRYVEEEGKKPKRIAPVEQTPEKVEKPPLRIDKEKVREQEHPENMEEEEEFRTPTQTPKKPRTPPVNIHPDERPKMGDLIPVVLNPEQPNIPVINIPNIIGEAPNQQGGGLGNQQFVQPNIVIPPVLAQPQVIPQVLGIFIIFYFCLNFLLWQALAHHFRTPRLILCTWLTLGKMRFMNTENIKMFKNKIKLV
jgi:hypothetical protein